MKTAKILTILVLALCLTVCLAKVSEAAEPMGTAFTYQGHLYDNNDVANGEYDFQFKLYDANVGGGQIGSDVNKPDVDVIDAYFTVELDFGGGVFDGNERWLEIGVRPGEQNDPCTYAALVPRQEITPTPYALQTRGIFVTDEGKVGIGTTSPGEKLEVSLGAGSGSIAGFSAINNTRFLISVDGVDSDLSAQSGNNLKLGTSFSGTSLTVLNSTGNVGIGETSPTAKLHIGGTAGVDGIKFPDGTLQTTAAAGGGDSDWMVSGNDMYSIPSGNVGIGTTSPSEVLDVNGTVKATAFSGDGGGLTNLPATPDGDWTIDGSDMYSVVSGNVGIGTTSPSEVLDVNGNININSVYKIDGATILSNAGSFNIFAGEGAGASNTSGNSNSAMGYQALQSNTTGWSNSAMGRSALRRNMSGVYNSAVGSYALSDNNDGNYNSAVGSFALTDNNDGNYNSAVGSYALQSNTTGVYNSAVGSWALSDNTTGKWNSAVGSWAGNSNSTGIGNVFLGYKAGYFETGDNKLYIDNSDTSTPLIYGDFATNVLRINGWAYIANRLEVESDAYFSGEVGIGTTSPTGKLQVTGDEVRIGNAGTVNYTTSDGDLYVEDRLEVDGPIWVLDAYNFFIAAGRDVQVDSTGRFGYGASSKRYKENIAPLEDDFSKILAAQPVAFVWKESKESDIGLIAEDIDELGLRNLVIYDAEGRPASVRYKFLSLYLLEIVKGLDNPIKELKAENESLNQRLSALESMMTQRTVSMAKEVQ